MHDAQHDNRQPKLADASGFAHSPVRDGRDGPSLAARDGQPVAPPPYYDEADARARMIYEGAPPHPDYDD